jgi:VanZ family protein
VLRQRRKQHEVSKADVSNKRRERIIRYAPLLIWIGVILFLSSGQGSMTQTSRFVGPLLRFLFPDITDPTLLIYHGYVRKFAHFAEYFGLGFLASRAFFYSSRSALRNYWYIFAFGIVLLISSFDEINQSFNPARTGSGWDTLLDISGGAAAIFLFSMYVARFKDRLALRS